MTIALTTEVARGHIDALISRATELSVDWETELQKAGPGPYTPQQVLAAIRAAAQAKGLTSLGDA